MDVTRMIEEEYEASRYIIRWELKKKHAKWSRPLDYPANFKNNLLVTSILFSMSLHFILFYFMSLRKLMKLFLIFIKNYPCMDKRLKFINGYRTHLHDRILYSKRELLAFINDFIDSLLI